MTLRIGLARLAALAAAACLGCGGGGGCDSALRAPRTPPAAVYDELVAGQCLEPSLDRTAAVAQMTESIAAHEYPWLACLSDGGSLEACAVPCEP